MEDSFLKEFNMCRDGLLTSGLIASMIDDESIQKDIEFFESFSQIRDKISSKIYVYMT